MRYLTLLFILFILMSNNSNSQDNDDCLMCHEDQELTMEKNGIQINIGFPVEKFQRSAHKKLKCINCHKGFDPEEIPHKENITKINCLDCHQDDKKKHFFHPQFGKANGMDGSKDVNCKNCHTYHFPEKVTNPNAKFNFARLSDACGECHTKQKAEHMTSIHFAKSQTNDPNTPNCVYCHKYQITEGYKLSWIELKRNREKLCLSCHLDEKTKKTKYSKTLIEYENSVHGQALRRGVAEAASCTDCHGVHSLQEASNPNSRINRANIPNVCGKCHIALTSEYKKSIHGIELTHNNIDVPSCTYCHGEHSVQKVQGLTDRVFTENHIDKLTVLDNNMVFCIQCHTDEKLSEKYNMQIISTAHEWLPNLAKHYETVRCVDCHSSYLPPNLSHNILPPKKTIKKCEECHSENSILMTKLYKHELKKSQEKYGFINGTLLSDAYVIGSTRNVFLDTLGLIVLSLVVLVIGFHALLRWYFSKGRNK